MIGSLPFQFRLGFRFVFFREMKKKAITYPENEKLCSSMFNHSASCQRKLEEKYFMVFFVAGLFAS